MPGKPGKYSSRFSGDEHPVVEFFWAMRDYNNKKKAR